MPSKKPKPLPIQLAIRGSPEWGAAVRDLARIRGHENASSFVECLLWRFADDLGIAMPRRARPVGTNRYSPKEDTR